MRRVGGNGVDYSVWNSKTLEYDYYRAVGGASLRSGVIAPPPQIGPGTSIGVTPEDAARPLPVGSSRVGSGPTARGLIAADAGERAMGQFGVDPGFVRAGLLLGSAYLLYKYVLQG